MSGGTPFGYPVDVTQPVTQALASINGFYKIVYGYDATDAADPWKVYAVQAPAWVNDLKTFEYAHSYWISTTAAITVYLQDVSPLPTVQATALPAPPATYYGAIVPGREFAPAPGMSVEATIGGVACGRGVVEESAGTLVYVVDVVAAEQSNGCGAPGAIVHFSVAGKPMATEAVWASDDIHAQPLQIDASPGTLYLPALANDARAMPTSPAVENERMPGAYSTYLPAVTR
ncbi:MAG: hypothetical protein IPK16_01635 [Anaerolineales bacterium]|nr:hypothetical protein [Anaerolineales bacterium]